MAYKISVLNKCLKIAAGMDPKRYLSKSGPQLVEIIRLLLPDSGGQPGNVCKELVKIGRSYKWDLPRISPEGEASFLLWLVTEVAATSATVPGPVPVPPPAPAPASPATSRRR